jgi:hypothetical protein
MLACCCDAVMLFLIYVVHRSSLLCTTAVTLITLLLCCRGYLLSYLDDHALTRDAIEDARVVDWHVLLRNDLDDFL